MNGNWINGMQGVPGISLPEGIDANLLGGALFLFLLFLVCALFALILLARRRQSLEVREIVLALEDLRSGRLHHRPAVARRSGLSMIADSVQRLSQDILVMKGELQKSREQVEILEQAIPEMAIITTDPDGQIRTMNDTTCSMFGWSARDLQAQSASILFDEEFWKDLLPKLARRSFRESGLQIQGTMCRSDGSTFGAELSIRLIHRKDHGDLRPSGFVLGVRDRAGESGLAARLKAAEEQQRLLMEGITDGAAVLVGGKIVQANKAIGRMLDVDPEELQGAPFHLFVSTCDLLIVREKLEEIERRRSGGDLSDGLRFALRDIHQEIAGSVLMRASGLVYQGEPAVLILLRDVTRQARLEAELRRNEARLDAVLEASAEGILVLVETGEGPVVHLTNRAFCRRFKVAARDLLGVSEGDLLRSLSRQGGTGRSVAAILASANRKPARETVAAVEDGTPDLEVATTPLRDRNDRLLGMVLTVREISAGPGEADLKGLRSLQETVRRLDEANRKMQQNLSELEQYNRELVKLDEMKSRLLGNVSHELQTPLVAVRGYTEMILKQRLGTITQEQKKGLTLSLRSIDRMIALIDGLLHLSRDERLNLSSFRLRGLVEECVELMEPKMASRNLHRKVDLPDPDLIVHGDREKLFQVFVNLLNNAVKYNRDGGRIEIRTRPWKSGMVQVDIQDTGVGISPEEQKSIFDRFYRAGRAGTPVENEEGAGIGLSIVNNILRLHGCTIQVESEPGVGSTFTFTLPVESATGPGAGEENEAQQPESADSSGPGDADNPGDGPPRLRIIRPAGTGNKDR